ncbi:MAG TPA: hypothetical protein VKP30_10320, partial [Polyangiaceae bacterium]|nr:hypothetical protein [Polyangiaceae bacterium]
MRATPIRFVNRQCRMPSGTLERSRWVSTVSMRSACDHYSLATARRLARSLAATWFVGSNQTKLLRRGSSARSLARSLAATWFV